MLQVAWATAPLLSFGSRASIISVETVRPDRAELT
jgi:hypothetical protein